MRSRLRAAVDRGRRSADRPDPRLAARHAGVSHAQTRPPVDDGDGVHRSACGARRACRRRPRSAVMDLVDARRSTPRRLDPARRRSRSLTRRAGATHSGRGAWQVLWPGVYADGGVELDAEQRAVAARRSPAGRGQPSVGTGPGDRLPARGCAPSRAAGRPRGSGGFPLIDDDDPATGAHEHLLDDVAVVARHARPLQPSAAGRRCTRHELHATAAATWSADRSGLCDHLAAAHARRLRAAADARGAGVRARRRPAPRRRDRRRQLADGRARRGAAAGRRRAAAGGRARRRAGGVAARDAGPAASCCRCCPASYRRSSCSTRRCGSSPASTSATRSSSSRSRRTARRGHAGDADGREGPAPRPAYRRASAGATERVHLVRAAARAGRSCVRACWPRRHAAQADAPPA